MFRNYLKTALRNLKRNKAYTIINVAGLAVGIAATLLLFLVIRFETSFDSFHKKKESIFRVGSIQVTQDGTHYSEGVAFPVANGLRLDFPQIKEVASIFKRGESQVTILDASTEKTSKFQSDVFYTDPEFFTMFDFAWLAGDAKTALKDPRTAVLTQATAEKFFGDWHAAIGKTIMRENKKEEIYKINGILKNPPENSDFPLTIVVSYASLKNTNISSNLNDWVSTWSNSYTFVVLPKEYPVSKFNRDLLAFAKKHKPAEYAKDAYIAQPLMDIHFNEDFGNFRGHTFARSLITALTLIGIFLLLIACVNFINLATAQAANRSKEVGVRKVLGSNRNQLITQFLSETAIIVIASLLVGIAIAQTSLPFLNNLLDIKMSLNFIGNPSVLLFLAMLVLVVTVLSGFYPAIVLSRFNPIMAIKSKITGKMLGGISLRRGLVIMQFAIAHVLIIGTLIVVSQMNYFQNASLGFDKAAIINVPLPGDSVSRTKLDFLRSQLIQRPEIKNVSFSFATPSADGNWNSDFKFDNSDKSTNFSANLKWADTAYFKTYGIHFVAGGPYHPADTVNEFVVNETLLKKLGVTDPKQAIGKKINFWDGGKVGYIVGVVNDFNSYSLRQPMAPVVMSNWKDVYQTVNIKILPGKEKTVLAFVEKLWTSSFPDYVYKYQFLDETIRNFYTQENQLSTLYKIFAGIAIFISCLGLYGLVSFMVSQRTKEVGIRKVLGASARNIVYLLSKEFSLLILIAFVIAGPIAWYIMHGWLQNYSYRVNIGVTVFLLAIAGSMLIAWVTVGHRAVKAAIANPVKSLRTE